MMKYRKGGGGVGRRQRAKKKAVKGDEERGTPGGGRLQGRAHLWANGDLAGKIQKGGRVGASPVLRAARGSAAGEDSNSQPG